MCLVNHTLGRWGGSFSEAVGRPALMKSGLTTGGQGRDVSWHGLVRNVETRAACFERWLVNVSFRIRGTSFFKGGLLMQVLATICFFGLAKRPSEGKARGSFLKSDYRSTIYKCTRLETRLDRLPEVTHGTLVNLVAMCRRCRSAVNLYFFWSQQFNPWKDFAA